MKEKTMTTTSARLQYGSTSRGAPHQSTNLFYRIQMDLYDPMFFIEFGDERKPVLFTNTLEIGRAQKIGAVQNFQAVNYVPILERIDSKKPFDALIAYLKEQGIEDVYLPKGMPVGIADLLHEAGFMVESQSWNDQLQWYPERSRKTKQEIAHIMEILRTTEEVFGVVRDLLRGVRISVGTDEILMDPRDNTILTAEKVQLLIQQELLKRGAWTEESIVACGDQACDPHEHGHGPLRAHEPIVVDIYPMSLKSHYHADMTRTFFKGTPSFEVLDLYDTVLEGQGLGISMLKPGIIGSHIFKTVKDFFENAGYHTSDDPPQGFIHSFGHGVGLDLHELPGLGMMEYVLEIGNVVTPEPGLYYPGTGGVRIEDMVLIQENGPVMLSRFPKKLKDMIL